MPEVFDLITLAAKNIESGGGWFIGWMEERRRWDGKWDYAGGELQ